MPSLQHSSSREASSKPAPSRVAASCRWVPLPPHPCRSQRSHQRARPSARGRPPLPRAAAPCAQPPLERASPATQPPPRRHSAPSPPPHPPPPPPNPRNRQPLELNATFQPPKNRRPPGTPPRPACPSASSPSSACARRSSATRSSSRCSRGRSRSRGGCGTRASWGLWGRATAQRRETPRRPFSCRCGRRRARGARSAQRLLMRGAWPVGATGAALCGRRMRGECVEGARARRPPTPRAASLPSTHLQQELMLGGTLRSLVMRQMMQNPTPLYSDAAGLDICLQARGGGGARPGSHLARRCSAPRGVPRATPSPLAPRGGASDCPPPRLVKPRPGPCGPDRTARRLLARCGTCTWRGPWSSTATSSSTTCCSHVRPRTACRGMTWHSLITHLSIYLSDYAPTQLHDVLYQPCAASKLHLRITAPPL